MSTVIYLVQICNNKLSYHPQDMEIMVNGKLGVMEDSTYSKRSEIISLLNRETVSKANLMKEREATCRASSGEVLNSRRMAFLRFRPTLFIIATTAVCLGICSVLFHPHKVSEFAVSIRRCLLDKL